MAKSAPLGFRIPQEMKDALIKAAEDDERSVSSLVTLIVRNWLKEKGYLPK